MAMLVRWVSGSPRRPLRMASTLWSRGILFGGAHPGPLYAWNMQLNLALTALCDGQRVPEDFHLARAADVVLRAMQVARKPNAVPAMPPPVTTSFSSLEHARHG